MDRELAIFEVLPRGDERISQVSAQNIQSFLRSEIVTAVANPRLRGASFRL
jgi:hypothetical protein